MSASSRLGTLAEDLAALTDEEIAFLATDWQVWARDDQLPPGPLVSRPRWRTWLILGGRGAGKTRAGAEWIRQVALGGAPGGTRDRRIALVGETLSEVRRVMIEGVSGLLAIHGAHDRPVFESSKRRLVWPNGAVAEMFSSEDAEGLRGPQFAAAWCDEIAKWREPEQVWDMLQFALRLGEYPQVVATTTPRPVPFLKRLIEDETTALTRAATHDNAANLAPTFIAEMTRRYAGSALGRQELMGELIDERAGGLWRRDWIEAGRAARAPELRALVVAVDPPVTATKDSDACGIIVAGVGDDGLAYVLADRTVQGREPHVWARAAVAAYRDHRADRIVAEINQGGDLVVAILKQIDDAVPVRKVRATRGKWIRAEPVAALYAEGRVRHVGCHEALEDELCAFGTDGLARGHSPDRLDALVWALTDLMLDEPTDPQIRRL